MKHVLYKVHEKRGGIALQDIGLLPYFKGLAHPDAYSPYLALKHLHSSLCNAPLLREFVFALEQKHQNWARELLSLLCRIKEKVDQSQNNFLAPRLHGPYRKRYQKIVHQGVMLNPPPKKKSGKRSQTAKTKV